MNKMRGWIADGIVAVLLFFVAFWLLRGVIGMVLGFARLLVLAVVVIAVVGVANRIRSGSKPPRL